MADHDYYGSGLRAWSKTSERERKERERGGKSEEWEREWREEGGKKRRTLTWILEVPAVSGGTGVARVVVRGASVWRVVVSVPSLREVQGPPGLPIVVGVHGLVGVEGTRIPRSRRWRVMLVECLLWRVVSLRLVVVYVLGLRVCEWLMSHRG